MSDGFWTSAYDYGLGKLFTDLDFVASLIVLIISLFLKYVFEIPIINDDLLQPSTQLAVSLVAFILTGLAVLASFSDAKFLNLLRKLEIYDEIMFSFQYTLYLTMTVAVLGIILQTYNLPDVTFFIFVFLFSYMFFSITRFVSLIVELGKRQAEFEEAR